VLTYVTVAALLPLHSYSVSMGSGLQVWVIPLPAWSREAQWICHNSMAQETLHITWFGHLW